MHQNPPAKTKRVRKHYWQHPLQRSIRVPQKAAAVIAVMGMGVSDYELIAAAVGLTAAEVREIDMAEDKSIRQLGIAGIPGGAFFRLNEKIRCPKCDADVVIVPCVACSTRRA